jgi:hypothetical protein
LLVPVKVLVATISELFTVPADAADGDPDAGILVPHEELLPPRVPI